MSASQLQPGSGQQSFPQIPGSAVGPMPTPPMYQFQGTPPNGSSPDAPGSNLTSGALGSIGSGGLLGQTTGANAIGFNPTQFSPTANSQFHPTNFGPNRPANFAPPPGAPPPPYTLPGQVPAGMTPTQPNQWMMQPNDLPIGNSPGLNPNRGPQPPPNHVAPTPNPKLPNGIHPAFANVLAAFTGRGGNDATAQKTPTIPTPHPAIGRY
jgi:hypothetical protein